jgi:hypothetical protein
MSIPTPSMFVQYQMSAEENNVGMTFNHLNKQFLHNERTHYAEEKIRILAEDPNLDNHYFRRMAYLDGQIATLTYLIDLNPNETTTFEG